ncbi:TRAP transporter substrate-binding protein DctP [Orrella marina]|uniref:C4-dicarboxylate ABC transporter substrate-binding protein n=1 Tax=Orrella marina TaxID=2163011 RepID=A0A2R4XMJ6_9BURK|nr:TRAP transporter substrate-binding protein DctP [Orrella marina]AWB35030.1 C4-dicarboxylate ABC transporter substrate-binding protein [Orrella marina]
MKKSWFAAVATMTVLSSSPVFAVETVTAVHAFPPNLVYTQSFLDFVKKVNEKGEGVVQIQVRGGPEVIGLPQQPDAVRNGVVDMAYTAASFYGGAVPERDVMVASNTDAVYARENGGIDLLNKIHQDKMGVYYLGWFDSGVKYNLYTINPPKLDPDGNLTVEGMRLRSNPVYDAFFRDVLGAQPISIPTPEVYSALERGVVNSTGWTQIGLKDLNWNRFVKYRVNPAFFSTDMGVIVNLDRWNKLSDPAKKILQEVAIEHERESAEKFAELAQKQLAELDADGMQVVNLEGAAAEKFSTGAREATWNRMRTQMQKQPMGLEYYDTLIEKFNRP